MKKTLQEEFLEAFKNFEDVLASEGFTRMSSGRGLVAQYEDKLEPESDVRKGLQQCRIIRNAYQHENRVLFLPTQDAVKLLQDEAAKLDRRVTAKDIMKKPKKLAPTDRTYMLSAKDIDFILAGGVLPIVDENGGYIGGINKDVLIRMLTFSARKVQIRSMLADDVIKNAISAAAGITTPEMLVADLKDGVYAVVDSKDKYRGMIVK